MKRALKTAIVLLIVRPCVWFFFGLNRYSRLKTPVHGPCILAPNHNSHLDTLLLAGLLPIHTLKRVRFAASGEYFYNIPIVSFLLFRFLEMIPVWPRSSKKTSNHPDPIDAMSAALEKGDVIVIYPEGTRGLPEETQGLKRGVAKLAARFPDAPVIPIFMRGLGKSLPKGDKIFIPLIPQLETEEPLFGANQSEDSFMENLALSFQRLEDKVKKDDWIAHD